MHMYRHIYTYIHITNLCFRPWLSVKVLSNLPLPVYDCVLKGDSVCVCVCVCACMRMCDMRMCERECEWVGGSALCVERCVLSWRCVCVYVCVCMCVRVACPTGHHTHVYSTTLRGIVTDHLHHIHCGSRRQPPLQTHTCTTHSRTQGDLCV